jgi:hypothetical protein
MEIQDASISHDGRNVMNAFNEYRDANEGTAVKRREMEKAQDAADENECLERFADDGGSWINVEQCEEAYFKKSQSPPR